MTEHYLLRVSKRYTHLVQLLLPKCESSENTLHILDRKLMPLHAIEQCTQNECAIINNKIKD